MRKKPLCTRKSIVAQTRLFNIEEVDLHFSNGEKRVFERIQHSGRGAVMIVALTPNESLLLVREYAAGTEQYELAFPKGLKDAGETCEQAANRELQEEVGFAANKLTYIRSMSLAPAYFGATIDLVIAEDLYPSSLQGDEPEPPELVAWPLTKAQDLLSTPDFTESRSIAALFLIQEWLKTRKLNHE